MSWHISVGLSVLLLFASRRSRTVCDVLSMIHSLLTAIAISTCDDFGIFAVVFGLLSFVANDPSSNAYFHKYAFGKLCAPGSNQLDRWTFWPIFYPPPAAPLTHNHNTLHCYSFVYGVIHSTNALVQVNDVNCYFHWHYDEHTLNAKPKPE